MQCKHGDKILILLLVILTNNKMAKIKKKTFLCVQSTKHTKFSGFSAVVIGTMEMKSTSSYFSLPMLIVLALSTFVPKKYFSLWCWEKDRGKQMHRPL